MLGPSPFGVQTFEKAERDGSPITTVEDDKKRGIRESRICLPTVRVCGSQFFGEIRICLRRGFEKLGLLYPGHRSFVSLRMTI